MGDTTYMRDYHLPAHQHQIVHPDPRPLPPTRRLLPARPAHPELRAYFPAPVEEDPDGVAFFDAADAAGDVGAVVEDEGDEDLGGFDGVLQREEVLAELLARLGVAEEGGFGEDLGGEGEGGGGAEAAFLGGGGGAGAGRGDGGVGRGGGGGFGVFGGILAVVVVVVEAEGEFALGGVLALFLQRVRGRRGAVL